MLWARRLAGARLARTVLWPSGIARVIRAPPWAPEEAKAMTALRRPADIEGFASLGDRLIDIAFDDAIDISSTAADKALAALAAWGLPGLLAVVDADNLSGTLVAVNPRLTCVRSRPSL
jgi:hypothetical protein